MCSYCGEKNYKEVGLFLKGFHKLQLLNKTKIRYNIDVSLDIEREKR